MLEVRIIYLLNLGQKLLCWTKVNNFISLKKLPKIIIIILFIIKSGKLLYDLEQNSKLAHANLFISSSSLMFMTTILWRAWWSWYIHPMTSSIVDILQLNKLKDLYSRHSSVELYKPFIFSIDKRVFIQVKITLSRRLPEIIAVGKHKATSPTAERICKFEC